MGTKFQNLRNNIEDLEDSDQLDLDSGSHTKRVAGHSNRISSYILLFAFLATLVFYAGNRADFSNFNTPIEFIEDLNRPSQDLLNGMGEWMAEMGYGELTDEELIDLRQEGVTATFTSEVREAGFTDITLDQLVELRNAGVTSDYITTIQGAGFADITLDELIKLRNERISSDYVKEMVDIGYTGLTIDQLINMDNADVGTGFTRMMKELGYELTPEDLVRLRENDVTAYFTSNMMDLGYTIEELTIDALTRMRGIGVTHGLAERLMDEKGSKPTIEELIRDRISNQ
ncbi:MAG: hypothetical protein FH748_12250 [Balneolaceae bacterium]|nr:hypothetical protein [Balneolaceae bacterium]